VIALSATVGRCGGLCSSCSLLVMTCTFERAFMASRHFALSASSVDAFFVATVAARFAIAAAFLASAWSCVDRPVSTSGIVVLPAIASEDGSLAVATIVVF